MRLRTERVDRGAIVTRTVDVVSDRDELPGAHDPSHVAPAATSVAGRVASVDTLRGLTILLMVFVNDLGPGAPAWMHHIQPPRADGMTLADVVFPAFLFIVGVSIPLAFERAREAGKSGWRELGHIFTRTAALLLMGLIDLNRADDRSLQRPLWGLIAFSSLILAWSVVPREPGVRRKTMIGLKSLGIVGLLALLALYRREPLATDVPIWGHVEHWVWLRTGWWGILGLIGWAYLTVSILTLLLRGRREWLMGAMWILMVFHLAQARGGLFTRLNDKPWLGAARGVFAAFGRAIDGIDHYIGLAGATGSLAAVTMAGCLLGSILQRGSDVKTHRARLSWALTFIIGLILAGFVADKFEGINKIGATPTWCFFSAALACIVWTLLYLVMDVAGFRGWSIIVRPAGANPLVAYFMHPIVIWLIALAGLDSLLLGYKSAVDPGMVVGGSVAMAFFVCAATGVLARLGLRMRL
jgi:heparan-alpha-glucosaminide N-acetyltransferase